MVLKGAKNTIQRFKPRLTIAAYHYNNEVRDIVKFLKNIAPFYKIQITGNGILNAYPSHE
ncbi:MAG: hypothetical protein DRP00_03755 [Candidatus Aenigmatarchaeota archaeon]|nr:MAG: hypothetical protein DRP00_03755 [Candidatus Aenigmarchaeota archaeon]